MKAIVEEINSVQRRVKVTVPSEDVNKAFSSYFQRIRGKAKIHGFRPGKAPLNLIKKMYNGSGSYDIVDQLIREHLMSAIRETGVRAISQPYVENAQSPIENQAFEITAIVDVLPEIKLQGLHKDLSVTYQHHNADDHMLDHRLDQIAREHARIKPVEADVACALGNLVKIRYKARMDGKDLPELSVEEQVVELGRQRMFSPEMEAALVGMRVGESRSVSTVFKGENIIEKFRDKTVDFDLSLLSIQNLEVPAIDAEFAKDLNFESVEGMKEKIRAELANYYERLNQDAVHNALLIELNEKIPFEVPPSITDQVIDHIISQMHFKSDAERQKALGDVELRGRVLAEAKMRAKNTMLLHELIKEEQLTVTDEEVREKAFAMAEEKDPVAREREASKNIKEFGDSIREQVLFNKALKFLLTNAQVHRIPVVHDHSRDHEHEHDDHDHIHHEGCDHEHHHG